MVLLNIDYMSEAARTEQYRQDWLEKRAKLNKTVTDCAKDKTTPPNNYWEPEHRARGKFLMAAKIMSVLEGL